MTPELIAHIKALVEKRNEVAQAVTAEGISLIEKKAVLDKAHKSDCPCLKAAELRGECTDSTYKEGMGDIDARIKEQSVKRNEVIEFDKLIEQGTEMAAVTFDIKSSKVGLDGPVTGQAVELVQRAMRQKQKPFLRQVGDDFGQFVKSTALMSEESIKNNSRGAEPLKHGGNFHTASSFYATFAESQTELDVTTKSIGLELGGGLSEHFSTAMKSRRDATKSMFTQHPLAGGDGSLYAPTEIFPGNTGGLCEYVIDEGINVLPYPPLSFLSCVPIRTIAKPYLLYVRQTLRINNASGVGEAVQLSGSDNPTDAPVNFRPIKPESEFGFSQAKAYTITFADTLPVSEEFLEDCPTISDAVETQLLENVRQEFYDQVLNGDGSDGEYPEILGLLAQVGLSTRVHRGAASFFGNTMMAGSADDDLRETVERAVFDAQAYGYTVDCAITSFDDYINMTFIKDELGHRLYTDEQLTNIRGAKLTADVRMPQGTAMVGAFGQSVQLLMRRSIRLDIGWVDKQFVQDMLTLRATMRGGLVVKIPHALIRITGIAA